MLVSDLMKNDVLSVAPDTTLADAARIMISRHVSGLPVVEDGKLVGVITEGDLLRRAEIGTDAKEHGWFRSFFLPGSLANEFVRSHGRYVRDVMTPSVITVFPDTDLGDAAKIMFERHIKRLPVVDCGKLVGVISRTDLLAVLARRLIELDDPLTAGEIKNHILNTLRNSSWVPKSAITVKVTGDIVDLEGVVFSESERRFVRVIAETTPGVKQVHDHMYYVDPTTGMSLPVA
jgi:CBS domain-containing protein